MMQKLRAWDKEEKRMWNVEILYIEDEWVKVNDGSIYGETKDLVRNYELMRSMGLTNKLGDEIYEGDILEILELNNNKYIYGELIYKNGVFGLKNEEINYDNNDKRDIIPLNEIGQVYKVIGNKYETPELIGGYTK